MFFALINISLLKKPLSQKYYIVRVLIGATGINANNGLQISLMSI